jgi:hypothetical protein
VDFGGRKVHGVELALVVQQSLLSFPVDHCIDQYNNMSNPDMFGVVDAFLHI